MRSLMLSRPWLAAIAAAVLGVTFVAAGPASAQRGDYDRRVRDRYDSNRRVEQADRGSRYQRDGDRFRYTRERYTPRESRTSYKRSSYDDRRLEGRYSRHVAPTRSYRPAYTRRPSHHYRPRYDYYPTYGYHSSYGYRPYYRPYTYQPSHRHARTRVTYEYNHYYDYGHPVARPVYHSRRYGYAGHHYRPTYGYGGRSSLGVTFRYNFGW